VARSIPTRPRLRSVWLGLGLVGLSLAVASAQEGEPGKEGRPAELPYETPGGLPLLNPDYRMTSHKVVLITDEALNPRRVDLEKGQLVAWISYSGHPATIVFERETAKSMICHSLVNFSIKDDELKSAPIHAGEFASFCELKPGRYKYRIVRPNPLESALDAARRLEGEIIVGNPQGG
jgi:hypothetical protein